MYKESLGVMKIGIKNFKRALTGVIVISVIIISFIIIGINKENRELIKIENGQILSNSDLKLIGDFQSSKDFMGNVSIEGTIVNISEEYKTEIILKFDLFDKNGVKIGTAETESMDIEGKGKIKIRALGINPNGITESYKIIEV